MKKQTLQELKEENAKLDEVTEGDVPEEQDAPDLDADKGEEVPESEPTDKSEGEPEGEEVEPWMQAEDDKGGFVPNAGAAAVKRKLKAKLAAKDEELYALRAKVEALEVKPVKKVESRPKREDFDFDDEAYDRAVDEWNEKRLDEKLSAHVQRSQQDAQQSQAQQARQKSVDDHYNKAAQLVASGKVSEEAYRNADYAVRSSLDRVFPGRGDSIADSFIHTLNLAGEGSDKVMYQLGITPSKLMKLEGLMQSDPSGLAASTFLGSLQSSLANPVKRRSTAPPPAVKVEGDSPSKGPGSTLYKEYKKHRPGTAESFRLKRSAKKQGVDVSQW